MFRRWCAVVVALTLSVVGGLPAVAGPSFAITAPSTLSYDPSIDGFTVGQVSITDPPDYLQLAMTLVDSSGNQVARDDEYQIAVGNRCTFDSALTNPATGGTVVISGDNSPTVLFAGHVAEIEVILANVWIYRKGSNFCGSGTSTALGQSLLNRRLQVTGVPSEPGLWWSPATKHYYQLATQTTSDGMGQPTDGSGNVTDPSRYFVRWSTARAAAKNSTVTIGGQTHRGYLASIITKAEFAFLNDNVSGGAGSLFPAWVGGSDQGAEGVWKWVDGPEALKFGGDTLTHYVDVKTAPDGKVLELLSEGGYGLNYPTDGNNYYSTATTVTFMRDESGNKVLDPDSGFWRVLNPNGDGGYCQSVSSSNYAAWEDFQANGPQIEATPYGSFVACNMQSWWGWPYVVPQLQDANGNAYGEDTAIFKLADYGYYALDGAGNYLAVQQDTSDFTDNSGVFDNYDGAWFWGQDSGAGPGAAKPNYCTNRGVRGVCQLTQRDSTGSDVTNSYYVYWSNGDQTNSGNWDGTGNKPGDGVYSPQPDNFDGNNSAGEDGLIINWCERNAGDYSISLSVSQSLYGNSGYHCTPGWNDLSAGDWALSSLNYPNGSPYDTPNHIGTTDYVIEFCGYDDEASCEAPAAAITLTSFSAVDPSGCGSSTDTNLNVSYAAAGVVATDLTSPTMATETFDNIAQGQLVPQVTAVGYLSGSAGVYPAGPVGGAGGTGNFPSASDLYLTLPTLECYVGFWWSAGNPQNFVQLLDLSDNVLATFSAADLVAALGNCAGSNSYCGNPSDNYSVPGELFAYVHMRLPIGFNKVHFYGQGFELDNISTSVGVPGRTAGETSLENTPVTTDCSSVTAESASQVLTACPRTLTITAGSSLTYATLAESQIADYTYPAGVVVSAVQIHSGVGQVSLVDSQHILLSSSTAGQFFADFTISSGTALSASRITVNVVAASSADVVLPQVILVDPQLSSVALPEFPVSSSGSVSLCYRQVANSQGASFSGSSPLIFAQDGFGGQSSTATVGGYFVISGSSLAVQSDSGHMIVSASTPENLRGSFVEVSAVSNGSPNSSDCASGTKGIFQVSPYQRDYTQQILVELTLR